MDKKKKGRESPSPKISASLHCHNSNSGSNVLITALGLAAFCREMAKQGVKPDLLLEPIGLTSESLDDPATSITRWQKFQFLQNIKRMTRDPAVGLRAGQQHQLHDLGLFGYALASFPTLERSLQFGFAHDRLAGSILDRSLRVEKELAVIEGHDNFCLQALLPLVVEYSFSTMHRLIELIMEKPFQSLQMRLPYPAPAHARLYSELFQCDVEFSAGALDWRFDSAILSDRCPRASLLSERMSASLCESMFQSLGGGEPALVRAVRQESLKCINDRSPLTVDALAERLNLSARTLRRRLAELGFNCQDVIEDSRNRLAKELLGNTRLRIDDIAERVGYSDASSFRKAFKRWTNTTPADYRSNVDWRDPLAQSPARRRQKFSRARQAKLGVLPTISSFR
ncbi:MAG: AraC family transcriptional regulator [Alphaproteobacteria bacterium]|nr:AraC family transcriptional regulator [Alphaproteobacteria bacterium]